MAIVPNTIRNLGIPTAPYDKDDDEVQEVNLPQEAEPEKAPGPNIMVETPDGKVTIHIGGLPAPIRPLRDEKFDANLAVSLSGEGLGALADDLLRGI